MNIVKKIALGKIIIDIPVEVGDTMIINGNQYMINSIDIFSDETIFLVNRRDG